MESCYWLQRLVGGLFLTFSFSFFLCFWEHSFLLASRTSSFTAKLWLSMTGYRFPTKFFFGTESWRTPELPSATAHTRSEQEFFSVNSHWKLHKVLLISRWITIVVMIEFWWQPAARGRVSNGVSLQTKHAVCQIGVCLYSQGTFLNVSKFGSQPCFSCDSCACRLYHSICMGSKTSPSIVLWRQFIHLAHHHCYHILLLTVCVYDDRSADSTRQLALSPGSDSLFSQYCHSFYKLCCITMRLRCPKPIFISPESPWRFHKL